MGFALEWPLKTAGRCWLEEGLAVVASSRLKRRHKGPPKWPMPTFPLSARLSERHHYSGVFNAPQIRVSTRAFLILAKPSSTARSRIGIVVAKKHIRNAARRNRVKRIIREHFRLSQPSVSLDLVILARKPADQLSNPLVWQDLHHLWLALNTKARTLCVG